MTKPEIDDEDALIRAAQSDLQAFGTLYDRYVDRIYAFAFHQTGNQAVAQDVTAATFEKALKGLAGYELRGFNFGAWLYRIARNELVQHYRRSRWIVPFFGRCLDRQIDENAFENLIEQRQQHALLLTALSQLSFDDRMLLNLRFYENLPSEQVAQILRCSLPSLYVRLHRALKRLRSHYDRIEQTPEMPQKETSHA